MKSKILSCLSLLLLVTGCSTPRENNPINAASITKPSKVVVAVISGIETPGYYKAGQQGLLDFAVNHAIGSSIEGEIEKIDAKPIVQSHYNQLYEKTLQEQSFQVVKLDKSIKKEELSPFGNESNKFAPFDFRALKDKHNAEHALVLHPHAFGIERNYRGFMPLGTPYGKASVSVYMVRLKDNALVGNYLAEVNAPVAGEWDVPPAYKNLTEASKKTLKKALQEAQEFMFSSFPQSKTSV